jgi:hypothetical protein
MHIRLCAFQESACWHMRMQYQTASHCAHTLLAQFGGCQRRWTIAGSMSSRFVSSYVPYAIHP